jgi:polysaccharide biosynthesis protein PslH
MKSSERRFSDGAIKSLFFVPQQLWPANTGARLRNLQLARQLALQCSVTVAELRPAEEDQNVSPDDFGFSRILTLPKSSTYTASKIARGLVGPTAVTILNCWSAEAASELVGLFRSCKFDTAQIEGVHLLKYLPLIRRESAHSGIIIDWHNIESEVMWRYAKTTTNWAKKIVANRTATLIERAENDLLDACATHTVTSERERQKLLSRRPRANIQVIPNGIDTNFYTDEKLAETRRQSGHDSAKKTILFVGSMDYHANIDAVTWFSREIWPEIARNHPDIQFTIVGRNPAPQIRALASDRMHVTGTVNDVRPFYASALAAVVPLRSGSGTRVKILEAMAAGVPVVSTRLGAEGIDVEDGVHLLLADSARDIAAAVGDLVASPESRVRLTRVARNLVSRFYDWSTIGEQLYKIHADIARSRMMSATRELS